MLRLRFLQHGDCGATGGGTADDAVTSLAQVQGHRTGQLSVAGGAVGSTDASLGALCYRLRMARARSLVIAPSGQRTAWGNAEVPGVALRRVDPRSVSPVMAAKMPARQLPARMHSASLSPTVKARNAFPAVRRRRGEAMGGRACPACPCAQTATWARVPRRR
jgi:hypothetical protein